ncbi:MAG: hypothetical protein HFJ02_03040 [Bacilli bacterium]|nr:hypothetical protein [Bacilli bacterium]
MKITQNNQFTTINLDSKMELFQLLKRSQFIGYGKTSYCFKLPNGLLLKIYRQTNKRNELFNQFDMKEHILNLSTLNNDTFIAPKGIILYQKGVLGYLMDYKRAHTVEKISLDTKVESLMTHIEKLIEDTYLISSKNFLLGDVHNRNILFNGYYYVIDLDFGLFESSKKDLRAWNSTKILKTILETIFKVKDDQLLIIDNIELFNLYNATIYRDYKKIYEFFEAYKNLLNTNHLNIRKLQRSFTFHKERNTYYKYDYD